MLYGVLPHEDLICNSQVVSTCSCNDEKATLYLEIVDALIIRVIRMTLYGLEIRLIYRRIADHCRLTSSSSVRYWRSNFSNEITVFDVILTGR